MNLFIGLAALILVSVLLGLVRIFKGPTEADRMLAAQLLGTGGVAILLILAFAMQMPALLDVALVYALLGSNGHGGIREAALARGSEGGGNHR